MVQLLLLRDSKEPRTCAAIKFIKGNLYGVPAELNLDALASPMGLQHLSRTEEPSYEGNTPYVSAIPAGVYEATIRTDRRKPWMINDTRAWRLELLKTGPRSAVQFHYGKDYKWSQGCIILTGNEEGDLLCHQGSDSPEEAVAALRSYVLTGHQSTAIIRVKIAFSSA